MTDNELDRESFAAFHDAVRELLPTPNESALATSADPRDRDTATLLHWMRTTWAYFNAIAGDDPDEAHEFSEHVTFLLRNACDEVAVDG